MVIIHTHSDDERGDLWFTSGDGSSGDPAAMPLDEVYKFLAHLIILIFFLVLQ